MTTLHALDQPTSQGGARPRRTLEVIPSRPARCQHHLLDDPTGLQCVLDAHTGAGHVYLTSSGSDVDDTHPDGGHG